MLNKENLKILTACMDQLGFDKYDVAKGAGVEVRTVERWLAGHRNVPPSTIKLFELVCMVRDFQADVYTFITEEY